MLVNLVVHLIIAVLKCTVLKNESTVQLEVKCLFLNDLFMLHRNLVNLGKVRLFLWTLVW